MVLPYVSLFAGYDFLSTSGFSAQFLSAPAGGIEFGMSIAPAIIDVRPDGRDASVRLMRWLRGISVRQVRLVCGLVMFTYIFSHFFNHALGNYSYSLMETWLAFHIWWWRTPIVNYTLYAAATIHFLLGL